jgi:hypothetical protein
VGRWTLTIENIQVAAYLKFKQGNCVRGTNESKFDDNETHASGWPGPEPNDDMVAALSLTRLLTQSRGCLHLLTTLSQHHISASFILSKEDDEVKKIRWGRPQPQNLIYRSRSERLTAEPSSLQITGLHIWLYNQTNEPSSSSSSFMY